MSHNPNLFTPQKRKLSFIAMNSGPEEETQEMAREVQLNPLELRETQKTSRSTSFAVTTTEQTEKILIEI